MWTNGVPSSGVACITVTGDYQVTLPAGDTDAGQVVVGDGGGAGQESHRRNGRQRRHSLGQPARHAHQAPARAGVPACGDQLAPRLRKGLPHVKMSQVAAIRPSGRRPKGMAAGGAPKAAIDGMRKGRRPACRSHRRCAPEVVAA